MRDKALKAYWTVVDPARKAHDKILDSAYEDYRVAEIAATKTYDAIQKNAVDVFKKEIERINTIN